jgi:hypothetical protein
MLGIHIDVATTWQRISAGDWMAYATPPESAAGTSDNGQHKSTTPADTPALQDWLSRQF